MSTKIYNGIMFKSKNIFEINKQLNAFSVELTKYTNVKLSEMLANVTVADIDFCTIYGEIPKDIEESKCDGIYLYYLKNYANAWKKLNEPYAERNLLIDYTCSISIHPLEQEGLFLGIVFAEKEEIKQMLFDKNIAVDYHYQNQTDPPEDILYEEWKKRGYNWDEVLKHSSIPSHAGFSKDLSDKYFPIFKVEEILPYIPSFKDRVERIGDMLAKKASGLFNFDKACPYSKYMSSKKSWDKYSKTQDGMNMIKEKQDYAEKCLIKDITKEHFLTLDFLHNG